MAAVATHDKKCRLKYYYNIIIYVIGLVRFGEVYGRGSFYHISQKWLIGVDDAA